MDSEESKFKMLPEPHLCLLNFPYATQVYRYINEHTDLTLNDKKSFKSLF